MSSRVLPALIAVLLPLVAPCGAQTAPASDMATVAPSRFITLGTVAGPVPDPHRSQPANVLVRGKDAYLIDAGDGAAEQLSKAGIRLGQIKAVFLSHLHFDHTGGLAAVLGLRNQTSVPGKLAIYGPPGTKELVSGIAASMAPAAAAGFGIPGVSWENPADTVEVHEIADKDTVKLGDMTVTARQNTHYSFEPGSDLDKHFKSLSLRFDMPDRSIVYTGDTGPSKAVEDLAKDADMLVAEMMDIPRTVEMVRRNSRSADATQIAGVQKHLTAHHLSPDDVGQMAARAGVKSVVVTHFGAAGATGADQLIYLGSISKHFHGPVIIASDLEVF
ncbi:MBL fold metallo-hydrolase [Emcibacter sp.]|uniref:MBL fold metallo-hydrolase n=1 Tax=Emcibacter sp. TaxID=1979954 RepID=UPI002AA755B4|nr:MBL fold metallo-hydrolase [Emcibacter sp.]